MHRHLASAPASASVPFLFSAMATTDGSGRAQYGGGGPNPVSNRCEHNSRQLPAWFWFWPGCCVIAYVVSYGLLHFVQICAAGPQICATKRSCSCPLAPCCHIALFCVPFVDETFLIICFVISFPNFRTVERSGAITLGQMLFEFDSGSGSSGQK